jgi:Carbohydrate family 9 binding domain-like
MKSMRKVLALACVLAILLTSGLCTIPMHARAESVTGSSVPFDTSGICVDNLADFNEVFLYNGVIADSSSPENYANDSTRIKLDTEAGGEGYLAYYSGEDTAFHSIAIDVGGFDKWNSANVNNNGHIAVFAATYSEADGLTEGMPIELTRELAPENMSKKDIGALRYIARSIPADTHYLKVKLLDGAYQISGIKLGNSNSPRITEYFHDDFDFAGEVADGIAIPDTAQHTNLVRHRAEPQYFGDQTIIKSVTNVKAALSYQMDFNVKSVYVSSFAWFDGNRANTDPNFFKSFMKIYTSTDGTNYTALSAAADWVHPVDAGDHYPVVYRSDNLPRNTKYVKVEFTTDSWGTPVLGDVILRGVDPADEASLMSDKTDYLDDFSCIYDVSDNMRFEHWDGNTYGDMSRIRRGKNEPGYVVYRTNNDIKDFEAKVFTYFDTKNVCNPEDIKVHVSTDGTDFNVEIPLNRTPDTPPVDPSSNAYIFTNAASIPDGYRYLKITVTGNVWDGNSPQIGYVKLSGYVPFDYAPTSQRMATDDFSNQLKTASSYSNNIKFTGEAVGGYDFEGDTTRVMRVRGNTQDAVLAYRTTSDIRAFSAEVFNYYKAGENSIPMDLKVDVSGDGISYTNAGITVNKDQTPGAEEGWKKITYSAADIPAGMTYIRFTVSGIGDTAPHIGKVTLAGIDRGEKQFNFIPGTIEVPRIATTVIKKTAVPVKVDGSVETDANGVPTGDWQDANSVNIAGVVDTNGNEHSAKIYFQYDYENLYIAAKIKDPTPMINPNTGNGLWAGDNLELFMGAEDINYIEQPGKTGTMLPSDRQLVLSGGIDNGYQHYVFANGSFTYPPISMDVKKDADGKGYTIEAAVPLDILGISSPWEGRQMILSAVLNNGEYEKRGQWGWTTNGEGDKKKRGLWGLATFETAPAPRDEVTVDVSVNGDTGEVAISGKSENVQSKYVTVLVRNPEGNICYIDQIMSDAEGNYAFAFTVNTVIGGSGTYTVTVGGEEIYRTKSSIFNFTHNPEATSP